MTIRWRTLVLALLAASLSACGTTYAPIALDIKNDQYATGTQLDAGATRVWEADIDLTQFRIVMLATQSNIYPLRFAVLRAQSAI